MAKTKKSQPGALCPIYYHHQILLVPVLCVLCKKLKKRRNEEDASAFKTKVLFIRCYNTLFLFDYKLLNHLRLISFHPLALFIIIISTHRYNSDNSFCFFLSRQISVLMLKSCMQKFLIIISNDFCHS